jgi:hypothetical protein
MRLEEQVCTLEQARKLKNLGIKQNWSYAAWLRDARRELVEYELLPCEKVAYAGSSTKKQPIEGFAAFTSGELEDMLLACFFTGHAFKSNDKWAHTWGHQKNGGAHSGPILSWHDTAAQARAGMLIYLLENGSLSPGQVNERLMDKNS